METIKDRIRIARDARGLTQEAVGAAMGVSRISALNWESKRKKATPESHRLPRLAELLGVRIDWLLTGSGPMTDTPEEAPIPGGALDRSLLFRVVVALERYAAEHALDWEPADKGEIVLAVYDWAEAEGAPDEIDVSRISSLLRVAHPRRNPHRA